MEESNQTKKINKEVTAVKTFPVEFPLVEIKENSDILDDDLTIIGIGK